MDSIEAHCVVCNLSIAATDGVGLIGNGGLICRRCYLNDRDSAREIAGRNPDDGFVQEPEQSAMRHVERLV